MLILFLILLIQHASAECVYDNGYSFDMPRFEDPLTHRTERSPLGLAVMNEGSILNTIDKCVNLCVSLPWCIAVSDHPYPNEHLCQFHTDRALIGLTGHFKCDNTNFKCEVDGVSLLNFDGKVFEVVNVDSFGFKVDEKVMPSRIVPFEEGDGKFCKVIKSDGDVAHEVSKDTKLYSEYYGTEAGVPGMWTDYDGKPANGGANFYRPGTNVPVSGYPITAIRRDEIVPAKNLHPFDNYNFYRHEYWKQNECSMPLTDDEFIDPEALKGDTYFLIKHSEEHYLKCEIVNDDGPRKCSWTKTPEMMWTVAEFKVPQINSDHVGGDIEIEKWGYDHVVIGYDMNGNEIGWIDRSKCHSDTDDGDAARLLSGGKKNGQSNIHCGASNWNFIRMEHIRTPTGLDNDAKIGGGSALCHNEFRNGAFALGLVTACMTERAEQARVGAMCSLIVNFAFKQNHMCTRGRGAVNANQIHTEVADFKKDGKLYEIYSDDTKEKRMVCSQYGDMACRWVTVGPGITKQIVKFNNNFVSNSVKTKITDQSKIKNAHQTAAVYELVGSLWTLIGNLAMSSDKKNLVLSNAVSNGSVNGWIKNGNKIFKQHDVVGVVAENGDKVQISKNGIKDLVFVEKTGFNNNTELYKWITDSDKCPSGYYLHQTRCLHDQLCNKAQLGCMKANGDTCKMNATATAILELKRDQFVSCPTDQIVVGRNASHIHCQRVDVTPVPAPASKFPSVTSLGFISKIDNNATKTVINAANWRGTPIQGLNPKQEGILEWHYDRVCFVDFENSRTVNKGDDFPSANRPDQTLTCSDVPNEMIMQTRCLTDDCRNGLEIRCETAKNCRLDGEPFTLKSKNGILPVCPFGMALTSITCRGLDTVGEKLIPCEKLEIKCQTVIFDPNYNPTKPPTPGSDDNKNTLKIILISLGVGLPLIVIGAIICLFCIPDNPTQVANERAGARVVDTREEIINSDYEGLRRRNRRVLMY